MPTNFKFWTTALMLAAATLAGGCGDEEEPEGEDAPRDATRRDKAVQVKISLDGSLQNSAWSPYSDELLLTRFRNGYNEEPADLFIIGLEDGAPRELVSDGSGNVNLPGSSWNAGAEIVVFSSSREPHDEIYIIDDGGKTGDEEQITSRDDRMAYEPSLSPDGEWVVFESHAVDQEDNGVITKLSVDGTGDYIALTDPGDDCRQPNWSPADGSSWEIWTMNDDGSGPEQITGGSGDKTDASFSPDGQWIVYSSDEKELDLANIFVIPAAGGESRRVTNWDGYDGAPSWSPDGEKIAFESYLGDPDDSEGTTIWIIEAPSM
jgi:TolB protein